MTNIPAPAVPLVNDAAARTGLPKNVVAAQINEESGFNPNAVSRTGAQGEFQFEPGTFKAQGIAGSPFNPNVEEKAYVKLMSSLLHQYGGNVRNALAAYNAGPGNLGAGLGYADTILKNAGSGAGLSSTPSRSVTPVIPGAPGVAHVTGGGLNVKALAEAVLAKEAARPIDTTGKVTASNPAEEFAYLASTGKYDNPTTTTISPAPTSTPSSGSLRTTGLGGLTHGGNLNPLGHPGWNIGRTDMGVDATATPGTPIEAVNDSKVVQVLPNWFRGQPLVMLQLTSGPDAGKYWYVAEQIAQTPHVGQTIQRGGTVAVYAPTGTGIEIGWGAPGGKTQAQATTGYHEGEVTPSGADFLKNVIR